MKSLQQIEFSSILFDSLFGLILFFGLDSFLEIPMGWPFVFYLFSTIILVHWWLIFKSADDAFDKEVTDSAIDLVFGIIYIILIEYIILSAKSFNLLGATGFLLSLLSIDLVWALLWRYVGSWNTKNKTRVDLMEKELDHNIKINLITVVLLGFLMLAFPLLSTAWFIGLFIAFYVSYIILTFKAKIIDIRIF